MSEMLTLEDLETRMDEKEAKQTSILNEVSELFSDAGFFQEEHANTIAFESSIKGAKALFSIDNTTFNYKSYISTEGENETNFSSKGNIDGIIDAAVKFVEHWAEFADGVEFTEDDNVEDVRHEVDED